MQVHLLRDELFWPGMMADFPAVDGGSERRGINFRAHEPDVDDLRGRIESVIPYFCANPGCIHTHCPRHGKGVIALALTLACWLTVTVVGNVVYDFDSPPAAVPRRTSEDYPEGASCGSLCFREIDSMFQVIPGAFFLLQNLADMAARRIVSSGGVPR